MIVVSVLIARASVVGVTKCPKATRLRQRGASCSARARGLGTCWTGLHLFFEEEVAKLLGIPYAEVMASVLDPACLYERDAIQTRAA